MDNTITNPAAEAANTPFPTVVSEQRRHYSQMTPEELGHVEARVQESRGAYYDL